MSAEGKKKRGESGQSNAKNIAFRYGGSHCDYSIGRRPGAEAHPRWNGSKLVQAFQLGAMLKPKHDFNMSGVLAGKIDNALRNCTVA
jgi:hypothetical protein